MTKSINKLENKSLQKNCKKYIIPPQLCTHNTFDSKCVGVFHANEFFKSPDTS